MSILFATPLGGSICKRSPCTDSCRITRHGSLGKATRDEAALLRHASVRIAWAPRHRASCVLGIVCSIVYVCEGSLSSLACPALYVAYVVYVYMLLLKLVTFKNA